MWLVCSAIRYQVVCCWDIFLKWQIGWFWLHSILLDCLQFVPGVLMKFFLLLFCSLTLSYWRLVPICYLSVQCYCWLHYASGSTLWRENLVVKFRAVLLQVAFFFFVSARHWRASLFISLGTLVLLLHGTFGVKFVQHMTSFHCRFRPFLALLFLLDIIIDFGYPCLVLLFMMDQPCW